MQLLKIVNRNVERLAQKQTANVLALAFKDIDELIVRIELHIKQQAILKHACNEHTQAIQNHCTCDYCQLKKEIQTLQRLRTALNYSYSWETTTPGHIGSIDERLNKLHNLRRQLIGVPVRIYIKPLFPKYKNPYKSQPYFDH
jgi:hypothetical protein